MSDRRQLAALPARASIKRALAYRCVVTLAQLGELKVARQLPLSLPIRWLGNHVVPWAARSAFVDGISVVDGLSLRIPRPPDWGGGGEFHMALGTYERPELEFLRARLRPGNAFVDVGSHIGYVALHAADCVGTAGRVFAFEPVESSRELLRENVALNHFTNVEVLESAVSDSVGVAQFRVDETSVMWGGLAAHATEAGTTIPVPTTTVDTVLAERGWPAIAGIKVDVEGAEIAVLRGAVETLERNPRAFILVEMQGGLRDRTERSIETLAFLEERGYSFARLRWRGGPRPIAAAAVRRQLHAPPPYNLFNLVAERASGVSR